MNNSSDPHAIWSPRATQCTKHAYSMLTFWPQPNPCFRRLYRICRSSAYRKRYYSEKFVSRARLVSNCFSSQEIYCRSRSRSFIESSKASPLRFRDCFKNMPRCFGTVGQWLQSLIRTRCSFRWNHICMPIGLSDSAKVKAVDRISRRLGSNQPLHKGSAFSNRERYVRSLVISWL